MIEEALHAARNGQPGHLVPVGSLIMLNEIAELCGKKCPVGLQPPDKPFHPRWRHTAVGPWCCNPQLDHIGLVLRGHLNGAYRVVQPVLAQILRLRDDKGCTERAECLQQFLHAVPTDWECLVAVVNPRSIPMERQGFSVVFPGEGADRVRINFKTVSPLDAICSWRSSWWRAHTAAAQVSARTPARM